MHSHPWMAPIMFLTSSPISQHTETLKLVFACYFRVLKHHQTSKLLPAVLEGLAKLVLCAVLSFTDSQSWQLLYRFAHLISVDFFRDLLEAMKQVMHSGASADNDEEVIISAADTRRRLLCSITAFQLLSGQGTDHQPANVNRAIC